MRARSTRGGIATRSLSADVGCAATPTGASIAPPSGGEPASGHGVMPGGRNSQGWTGRQALDPKFIDARLTPAAWPPLPTLPQSPMVALPAQCGQARNTDKTRVVVTRRQAYRNPAGRDYDGVASAEGEEKCLAGQRNRTPVATAACRSHRLGPPGPGTHPRTQASATLTPDCFKSGSGCDHELISGALRSHLVATRQPGRGQQAAVVPRLDAAPATTRHARRLPAR
jgi:hypothetical protein